MSEFNSLLGLIQMDSLDQILLKRKSIADIYNSKFNSNDLIEIPNMLFDENYNFTYYPILLKSGKLRNYLYNEMRERRIFVRKYYFPLLDSILNTNLKNNQSDLYIANDISSRILCLPIYPDLVIEDQMRIINEVLELVV